MPRSVKKGFVLAFSVMAGPASWAQPAAMTYDPGRLASYSTSELIDFFSGPSLEKNAKPKGTYSVLPPEMEADATQPLNLNDPLYVTESLDPHALDFTDGVVRELVRRHGSDQLMTAYVRTDDRAQRAWIAHVIGRMDDPASAAKLRAFVNAKLDDRNYFAVWIFGAKCDRNALAILNRNYGGYRISSMERASLAKIFGNCGYAPAARNLTQTLDATVRNLGLASQAALNRLYPDAHIGFSDPTEARQAWQKYIAAHP